MYRSVPHFFLSSVSLNSNNQTEHSSIKNKIKQNKHTDSINNNKTGAVHTDIIIIIIITLSGHPVLHLDHY